MQTSIGKVVVSSLAAIVLVSFCMVSDAEAQRRGGGGGGARGGGGPGAGGGGGPSASNAKADVRTNDVRSGSVDRVNVDRNTNINVDVDCSPRCGGWDHPVAAAAVVGGTIAAIGTVVAYPPAGCVPTTVNGIVYQQCGSAWYAPQGSEYVVTNPPQ